MLGLCALPSTPLSPPFIHPSAVRELCACRRQSISTNSNFVPFIYLLPPLGKHTPLPQERRYSLLLEVLGAMARPSMFVGSREELAEISHRVAECKRACKIAVPSRQRKRPQPINWLVWLHIGFPLIVFFGHPSTALFLKKWLGEQLLSCDCPRKGGPGVEVGGVGGLGLPMHNRQIAEAHMVLVLGQRLHPGPRRWPAHAHRQPTLPNRPRPNDTSGPDHCRGGRDRVHPLLPGQPPANQPRASWHSPLPGLPWTPQRQGPLPAVGDKWAGE